MTVIVLVQHHPKQKDQQQQQQKQQQQQQQQQKTQQKQQQSQYFKSCSTRDINSSVVRTSLLVPRYLHPRSKAHRCKYMRYHQSSRNPLVSSNISLAKY